MNYDNHKAEGNEIKLSEEKSLHKSSKLINRKNGEWAKIEFVSGLFLSKKDINFSEMSLKFFIWTDVSLSLRPIVLTLIILLPLERNFYDTLQGWKNQNLETKWKQQFTYLTYKWELVLCNYIKEAMNPYANSYLIKLLLKTTYSLCINVLCS